MDLVIFSFTPAPCHLFYARPCRIACPRYSFCVCVYFGQGLLVVWGTHVWIHVLLYFSFLRFHASDELYFLMYCIVCGKFVHIRFHVFPLVSWRTLTVLSRVSRGEACEWAALRIRNCHIRCCITSHASGGFGGRCRRSLDSSGVIC